MNDFIKIEVHDTYNKSQIKSHLQQNVKQLYKAMDLDVDNFDDRATVDDVTITEIELTEDTIYIEYDVEYSVYHGCKDRNYSDVDQREMSGKRVGSTFLFEKYISPPKRTTYEEF